MIHITNKWVFRQLNLHVNRNYFGKILKLTPKSDTPNNSNGQFAISSALLLKTHSIFQALRLKTNLSKANNSIPPFINSTNHLGSQLTSQNDKQEVRTDQQKQRFLIELIANIKQQDIKSIHSNLKHAGKLQALLIDIKNTKWFSSTIQTLIKQKSFTKTEKQYLTKLFMIMVELFKQHFYFEGSNKVDYTLFYQFIQAFNVYFSLIEMEPQLMLDYIRLINKYILVRGGDSNRLYFINQKIIVDFILQNKHLYNKIRQKEVLDLIGYVGLANMMSNYSQKYDSFVNYILSKLDQNWWDCFDRLGVQKHLVKRLSNLRIHHPKIMNGLIQILNRKEVSKLDDAVIYILTLKSYVNFKPQIYVDIKVPEEIKASLIKLTKFLNKQIQINQKNQLQASKEKQVYQQLIPLLYRSSIWQKDIWTNITTWLEKNGNFKNINHISLYSLFDLIKIDSDIIPKDIITLIQDCRNNLLLKYSFRVEDVNLLKKYNQDYGENVKTHFTTQQQIANNLRSVSQTTIKCQVLIHFFFVDIVMNQKTVIQINNGLHYVSFPQQNRKILNLKSQFRKRILEKLGYNFLEVEVDTFTEGNYQFLKIVEENIKNNKI